MTIDLNADVGEGGDDQPLLRVVTSANIACGAHAGDADGARRTIRAALDLGVHVGAHPSYPDREHFGRRSMKLPHAVLVDAVAEQVAWLIDLAHTEGASVRHVKPHGALYNDAAHDEEIAGAVADAVRRVDATLAVVGLAGSAAIARWRSAGLPTVAEAFCDRTYEANGALRDRRLDGALITDPAAAARQAVSIARDAHVRSFDGSTLRVVARTLCIHGDTPHAADIARAVRKALSDAGVVIAAPARDA